jgi:hypothetical protein
MKIRGVRTTASQERTVQTSEEFAAPEGKEQSCRQASSYAMSCLQTGFLGAFAHLNLYRIYHSIKELQARMRCSSLHLAKLRYFFAIDTVAKCETAVSRPLRGQIADVC